MLTKQTIILIKLSCFILLSFAIILLLYFLPQIVLSSLFIYFSSFYLHAIVRILQERIHLNKLLATLLVVTSYYLLIFLAIYFFLSFAIQQMILFFHRDGLKFIAIIEQFFQNSHHNLISSILSKNSVIQLNESSLDLDGLVNHLLETVINSIQMMIQSFSSLSLLLFAIIISTYFMTYDFNLIRHHTKTIIPSSIRLAMHQFVNQSMKSTFHLIKAQFILAIITALLSFFCFNMIGLSQPLYLAFIILFIDFIPYIGVGFVYIPLILYYFMSYQFTYSLILLTLYLVVVIFRQLVEPKVVGSTLRIHPLFIILTIYVTIYFFGITGLLLLPLILICLSTCSHLKLHTKIFRFIFKNV